MKRCPACQKVYEDSQNFCLDDGTTLLSAAGDSYGSPYPPPPPGNPYGSSSAPTEVLHNVPTAGGYGAPPTTPPAMPYMMSPTPKKSPLPWILLGALVLIGAGLGIYFATRGSSSTTTNTSSNGVGTSSSPTYSPGSKTTSTPTTSSSGSVYNSTDGSFGITLPPGFGPFTSQQKTQPTAAGPIELVILQSENTQGACVVGYSDFPEASFVGRTPKKMLEDGRDGALKNINATLEKQEDLTVQGKTGLAIYGSTNQGGKDIFVRFHFVLDKPRAYQIGYLAYNRADLDKPEVQAYFDSFHIK
jgi:hypothetical protein